MVKKRHGPEQQRRRGGGGAGPSASAADNAWRSDPRFGHLATDPRYRSAAARKATRVEIDARFKAMFTDPDFTTDAKSDKRGRPVAMSSRQDLRRFYGLKQQEDGEEEEAEAAEDEDDDEVGGEDEEGESANKAQKNSDADVDENDEDGEEEDDEEEEDEAEADAAEETEEDSDDEAEEGKDDEEDGKESSSEDEEFRALRRSVAADDDEADADDAADAATPTSRLAVTQQDWEQLKATDLFMLLSCRCPADGRLLGVAIYPSKFGMRRMAVEAASGPLELQQPRPGGGQQSSTAGYRRSLRRHQMKRQWYYYAVAEFDSAATAARVYEQCAGAEIESTGGCLRLSYVPDGMQFGGPDDVPAEWSHLVTRCAGLDPAAYKPCKFVTASLGRTRVDITWDETPAERTKFLQGLFSKPEFDEADPDLKRLSDFLAMSSDEDDDGDAGGGKSDRAAALARRRAALLGDQLPGRLGGGDGDGDSEGEGEMTAPFSDDELPDDVADDAGGAAASGGAAAAAPDAPESRKRSRRRRLKEQAKRAKLVKAGLLPASAGEDDDDGDGEDGDGGGEANAASEQELALLVADRSAISAKGRRVTGTDVASDERFGALFSDPSYHVDPTHSEAAKAADVQRLIVSAKRRAAMDT